MKAIIGALDAHTTMSSQALNSAITRATVTIRVASASIPGGDPEPPTPEPPTGGGDIPRVSLSVTVPEGFKPGTYQLVAVPRPEV